MTAAGEWLRKVDYLTADGQVVERPQPKTAGAIARSLADATQAYQDGLAELWRTTVDEGPWDD